MTRLRMALVVYIAFIRLAGAQSSDGPAGFSLAPGAGDRPVITKLSAGTFPLVSSAGPASFVSDPNDFPVVRIAEQAVAGDVQIVTGQKPTVLSSMDELPKYLVIAGTLNHSQIVDNLVTSGKLDKVLVEAIRDKWECFCFQQISNPLPGVDQALVVVGSDRRGTAYGLFELSRLIGVSPLIWWADVLPVKQPTLFLKPAHFSSSPPVVKYRGIFLNDEDWALHPWAANHLDADIKDIGPKTYARIFELLLRMRANLIWPAMHACTKAFYHYPDNPKAADSYAIVVGSSHAEPMLRDNVYEWPHFLSEPGQTKGEYRFDTNAAQVTQYWQERAEQSRFYESIYTIGMRGIHDSPMVGPKTEAERVDLLSKVIGVQRSLLGDTLKKPSDEVPQVFCPYKEVLGIYRAGLTVQDDITMLWPDDNHGYIRQLSSPSEQKRSGGSGVYYHLSYCGAPEDYLWLCSTSPQLISYEVNQALATGANRVWVFNVGDFKPAEMETQFAMDLVWNPSGVAPEKYVHDWAGATFGEPFADTIAKIKNEYYELAQEGKPEHVWRVPYSHQEAEDRLERYARIGNLVLKLEQSIPPELHDAYFELIKYPTLGASYMNEKVLAAKMGKIDDAEAAFHQIEELTAEYNDKIAGGKWARMMDWQPRRTKAYSEPGFFVGGGNSPALSNVQSTPVDLSEFTDFNEVLPGALAKLPCLGGTVAVGRSAASTDNFPPDRAPTIEYSIQTSPGLHTIHVHCIPGHPLYSGAGFRIGLSIDHGPLQITDLDTEEFSGPWGTNVLRGFAEAVIPCSCLGGKPILLHIAFPDPGMVVTSISVE